MPRPDTQPAPATVWWASVCTRREPRPASGAGVPVPLDRVRQLAEHGFQPGQIELVADKEGSHIRYLPTILGAAPGRNAGESQSTQSRRSWR